MCGSLSFAGIGLVGAGLVLVIRQAAATGWLAAVLTLLGGALFPPELLPGWARILAGLSPFTHTLAIARSAILEGSGWGPMPARWQRCWASPWPSWASGSRSSRGLCNAPAAPGAWASTDHSLLDAPSTFRLGGFA